MNEMQYFNKYPSPIEINNHKINTNNIYIYNNVVF